MTPELQRIAIAEACGWEKKRYLIESVTIDNCEQWMTSWFKDGVEFFPNHLPDYLNDLNACHEMEKSIRQDDPVWVEYCNILFERWIDPHDAIHTPPHEKSEAFLRALGLWKETPARAPETL